MSTKIVIKEAPCRFMVGYKESDRINGVDCNTYDAKHKCGNCGHNPEVGRRRLAAKFGEKFAEQNLEISRRLSEEYRKEHKFI